LSLSGLIQLAEACGEIHLNAARGGINVCANGLRQRNEQFALHGIHD